MKKALSLAFVLVVSQVWAKAEVAIGNLAPDFSVKNVEGQTRTLDDFKGKVVVLENYNLDCPYVQNHYKSGAMQALQGEATGKGVVWLVVNSSYKDSAKAKTELQSQKMKATDLLYDPSGVIGKNYGFKTTPHLIVINKDGQVVYNGAIDDKPATQGNPREARNYVRQALAEVLDGEPVTKAQTKPYGCGVKYAQ